MIVLLLIINLYKMDIVNKDVMVLMLIQLMNKIRHVVIRVHLELIVIIIINIVYQMVNNVQLENNINMYLILKMVEINV